MMKIKYTILKLRPADECKENIDLFLSDVNYILNHNDHYIVLGEVGDTKHYIVLNMTTGQIVPGMVHLGRFEEIKPEDY